MISPVPLEYVSAFAQTNQALMQQLATALLTSGEQEADVGWYARAVQGQQGYLQQIGALWMSTMTGSATDVAAAQPKKGDRRFASAECRIRGLMAQYYRRRGPSDLGRLSRSRC